MFCQPLLFQQYLSHHGLEDDIYKALGSNDLADPVITVLNILKKTNNLPTLVKSRKTETKSTALRNEGNQSYREKKFQKTLAFYHKALSFAPNNSRAMKLAYSNRSALLLAMKAPSACLKDIDKCFSMGCPADIEEKLRKRRDEARAVLWMEHLGEAARLHQTFSAQFFNFNVKRNPQIPCASTEVGVIVENQVPKIVATTDIKVGSVLAVETSFVSSTGPKNEFFSCHYCHKMNLHLIPCEGCATALFCDEECKSKCMKEYHEVECQIIELFEALSSCTVSHLAIKAFLKMKNMGKSWKELISASYTMGLDRIKTSSISEIYNSEQKFSLLSCQNERHMLNGPMYNYSFKCAAIVHYLDGVTGFFPRSDGEKIGAQKATARILMFLCLYSPNMQIVNSVSLNVQEKCETHDDANYGWFSFIGKLNNSCMPNVICVGLNKEMGLVALKPITKGTELTISYVGHWLDELCDKAMRTRNMFTLYRVVCNCIICTEEYKQIDHKLNDVQKKDFKKLNLERMREQFCPQNIPEIYMKLCKMLALLSDVPFSDEYYKVAKFFRRCLLFLQDLHTGNVMLDY